MDKVSVDDFIDMIYALGVLLGDENGLISKTLQRNFYEEFKDFTLMEAFECMVDEVNRVNRLLNCTIYLQKPVERIWRDY